MRSLWRTHGPTFRWRTFRLIGEPPNGRWQPIRILQIIGGRWWSLSLTRTGPIQPKRPKAAHITTAAERAPLYAAYAAARARGEQIGAQCDDDSIIQYAVKAYETAEMARLRAVLDAVESLTKDADGTGIDDAASIPVGEIRRALHETGPASRG